MDTRIYFARCIAANGADMGAIKIGCSCDVERRQSQVETLLPFSMETIATCPGDFFDEYLLHFWLRNDRISGEYFHDRGEVMRLAERATRTGKFPLDIEIRRPDDWTDWVKMSDAIQFMDQYGLTLADVAGESQSKLRTYDQHIKKDDVPNRRFVAALIVAALRKGNAVRWPSDFARAA